jgi:hypothetical protein
VLEGMQRWLADNGVGDVNDIIGCALPAPAPAALAVAARA